MKKYVTQYFDFADDFPLNDSSEASGETAAMILNQPTFMRFVFVLLFALAFATAFYLWGRIAVMDKGDRVLSLRGEMLSNVLVFLTIYASSWLPVLFLGILDGELETSSASLGLKGQIANAHCALQDLLMRSFCMSIVVSTAIYFRYASEEASEDCFRGRPNIFTWGTLLPVALVETTRFYLSQASWLMPTRFITQQLSTVRYSIKSTPVFCVQLLDESWLRQILAEWFLMMTVVVISAWCCFSCYRRGLDWKSKSDSESNSAQLGDSPSEEHAELQMERLLDLDSMPPKETPCTPSTTSGDSESVESTQSRICSHLDSESEGLYARGAGFLESVIFVGILWAIIIRPFMAITMYMAYTESYSNYLDIPTHVLLVIATAVLPMELNKQNWLEEEGEEEESTRKEEKDLAQKSLAGEKDDGAIWMDDEEKGAVGGGPEKDGGDDVDPIWKEEVYGRRADNGCPKTTALPSTATNSTEFK